MANKQNISAVKLGGNALQQKVGAVAHVAAQRVIDEEDVEQFAAGVALGLGQKIVKERMAVKEANQRLKAVAALGQYRQELMGASSEEEFERLAKTSDLALEEDFKNEKDKDFWARHGGNIKEAHQNDVKNLSALKSADFARNGLNEFLSDSQNVLAQVPTVNSRQILEKGTAAIEEAEFLDDDEKRDYRENFLKCGVLNLALQNPDEAAEVGKSYFAEDKTLQEEIEKTRQLREADFAKNEAKREREDYRNKAVNAISVWQAKETGQISDAAYYVLMKNTDKELLWGENEERGEAPLFRAYQAVRKLNRGEQIDNAEAVDAGNALINAYRQKKIGLQTAVNWQQKIYGEGERDETADKLIDKVFLADDERMTGESAQVMEQKAARAFDVYEVYNGYKQALSEEAVKKGENLNAGTKMRISREAAEMTQRDCGFAEVRDSVSYDELKQEIDAVYHGKNREAVWQKFFNEAPLATDKKELMYRTAAAQQLKELQLPRFDSFEEMKRAGLKRGDKFYFRGRLAVKS